MPMATYTSYSQSSGTRDESRISSTSRREESTNARSSSPKATESSWQSQQNSHYSQPLQTSYQHLQANMYSDPTQYSTQSYPYSGYQNYSSATYANYEGYGQAGSYMASGSMQPGPPGEEYPQSSWAPVNRYDNKSQTSSRPDGVVQEMKHQKAELMKQREEYERRVSVLRRELDLLRRQKNELLQNHSSDRDRDHILRENSKLQVEIQNKLKDAFNVIEILSGIIGENSKISENEESPKRGRSHSIDVKDIKDNKCNYIHYDPELHWCRMCDVFPKTAKDLLVHLHSKEHRDMMQDDEIPWHKLPPEPEFPFVEGATKKRLPIKGLQFFVSATAWYCRLCDVWVGDLHCASSHLRSIRHSQNYSNFVEQNPHWEIEWLKDRERALERVKRGNRSSDSEDNKNKKKKKRKDKYSPSNNSNKDKKKKKHSKRKRRNSSDSSSTSSSSGSSTEEENDKKDPSKSIHVAMRNKMKLQAQMMMNEELTGKWEAIGRLVEERKKKDTLNEFKEIENTEDNLINQWMTVKQPQDKDKILLENLKDRLKQKQEAEKIRQAELERKRKEKEKEEQEKKEKEEREARELVEAKQRERDEMERLKEIREQIKFKTREKYRRRPRSRSNSPPQKHARSPNYDHKRKTPERYRRREASSEESPRHRRKYDRDDSKSDRKPPPPPSYKKLPFIGRMPLFKNKKPEERGPEKEIKKEDYDIPRQTRFQPGNLARAFIPEPEVVCFPKLSSYPEIVAPPPPAPKIIAEPPAPPKITEPIPKAPPPPKINEADKKKKEKKEEEENKKKEDDDKEKDKEIDFSNMIMLDDNPLNDYHEPIGFDNSYSYGNTTDYNMMYPPHPPSMFDFTQDVNVGHGGKPSHSVPLSHTMPLQPPPLPPDDPNDDLAMLGISSDDLAAQFVK